MYRRENRSLLLLLEEEEEEGEFLPPLPSLDSCGDLVLHIVFTAKITCEREELALRSVSWYARNISPVAINDMASSTVLTLVSESPATTTPLRGSECCCILRPDRSGWSKSVSVSP